MATQFERAFVQHIVLQDSMKEIIERELPHDLMPSPDVTNIFEFSRNYWHENGQTCPTPEVLGFHFGNALAEHEIDLSIDPEGGLEWALSVAQNAYIDRHWQPWVREWTMKISGPDVDALGKVAGFDEAIQEMMSIQSRFTKKAEHIDVRVHGVPFLDRYAERAGNASISGIPAGAAVLGIVDAARGADRGVETFSIDETTGATRLGELTIMAGPPKSGKSFMLALAALAHWRRGGVPTLFTLENSTEMTLDRIVCMACNVDPRNWERGLCTERELGKINELREEILASDRPFHILQPERGKRTVEHIVRRGRSMGDALFVDQLTFIEPARDSEHKQRHQQVGDSLHELKSLISTGARIPCIMAHQINREGVKAAEKTGHLEMYHLAESAEVERTADQVFGLWQTAAMRDSNTAWLQSLAARRRDLVHWEMLWQPYVGNIAMISEIQLPDAA